MRLRQSAGVWELFVPRVGAGAVYKYELVGPDGSLLPSRADPVAWATELPPRTASVVDDPHFVWTDEAWMAARNGKAIARSADLDLRDACDVLAAA